MDGWMDGCCACVGRVKTDLTASLFFSQISAGTRNDCWMLLLPTTYRYLPVSPGDPALGALDPARDIGCVCFAFPFAGHQTHNMHTHLFVHDWPGPQFSPFRIQPAQGENSSPYRVSSCRPGKLSHSPKKVGHPSSRPTAPDSRKPASRRAAP